MSLHDKQMEGATTIKIEDIKNEFAPILIPGEEIEATFAVQIIKNYHTKWVFTNKRLILLRCGSIREYITIPYRSIDRYSIETFSNIDNDCTMKLWVKSMDEPLVEKFKRNTDIIGLQRALSTHVL